MEITIDVMAREEHNWSGPRGDARVTITTEADVKTLPWAQICANLVEAAIKRYEEQDQGEVGAEE